MNAPGTPTKTTCPTPRGTSTNRDGEVFFIPCGKLTCPRCGPATALKTASAIRLAAPDRAGYLSLPPGQLSTPELRASAPLLLRRAIRRIAKDVQLTGKTWETASVIELSASGRVHGHFLQRGDSLAPRELRRLAASHNAGWADLAPIRFLPVISRYVLKVPISALDMDPESATELLALHRELNGGRLLSSTPGFWRGAGGVKIRGVRAARRAAYREWAATQRKAAGQVHTTGFAPKDGAGPNGSDLIRGTHGWGAIPDPGRRTSQ